MNLPLFVYGSMRDEGCPRARPRPRSARGPYRSRVDAGVAAVRVPEESYPYLVSSDCARVPGELVHGLDAEDLDRILFFEGDEYGFVESVVERAGGERVAAMHFGGVAMRRAGRPMVARTVAGAGEAAISLDDPRVHGAVGPRDASAGRGAVGNACSASTPGTVAGDEQRTEPDRLRTGKAVRRPASAASTRRASRRVWTRRRWRSRVHDVASAPCERWDGLCAGSQCRRSSRYRDVEWSTSAMAA